MGHEKPDGFVETDVPMFYGHLDWNDSLDSIKGMSGGPVFAFRRTKKGLSYWLLAVQSTWLRDTKEIAACRIRPLAEEIANIIRKI